jgi:hypothetical protein
MPVYNDLEIELVVGGFNGTEMESRKGEKASKH